MNPSHASHRCSSTFSLHGRRVIITMTSPSLSPHGSDVDITAPGVWEYHEEIDAPTPVAGFHCPATFTVEGFNFEIEFSIAVGANGVFIDRMSTSFPEGASSTITLPLAMFAEQATAAAGRIGLQIPRDFSGSIAGVGGQVETGDEWTVIPLEARRLTKGERDRIKLKRLLGQARKAKVNEISDEILRKVAKAHRDAPYGYKNDAVGKIVGGSPSTVRDYIRKARERGLLEEVSNSDMRKNSRKK